MAKAGTTPRTFMIAGIDIIPAPTMLVATLNTAPETDAGVIALLDSPNSGTLAPTAGDMAEKKLSDRRMNSWVIGCLALNGFDL